MSWTPFRPITMVETGAEAGSTGTALEQPGQRPIASFHLSPVATLPPELRRGARRHGSAFPTNDRQFPRRPGPPINRCTRDAPSTSLRRRGLVLRSGRGRTCRMPPPTMKRPRTKNNSTTTASNNKQKHDDTKPNYFSCPGRRSRAAPTRRHTRPARNPLPGITPAGGDSPPSPPRRKDNNQRGPRCCTVHRGNLSSRAS